ncbi:MAG: urease accessory protein UreE [Hyphomicrobiales bacterium]|nr:urease accessory protein UreE [Hyphomicrobiales bacterium]
MLRATTVIRKPAVKADKVVATVVLNHEDRQRRRAVLKTEGGLEVLLDLERATALNEGDALHLDDGRLVQVQAAPEALLEVRAESMLRLMRVAWHIGNRHTPAEITADALYIEEDHVLAEMVRGQGCSITKVTRPFRPERGAYDHAGHDHGQHHDHGHDHGAHGHANPPHGQPGHVHGPDCGHDHHHDHSHDVLSVASHDHAHDHGHHHDHDHKHHHGHDHGHAARAKHDH